VWSVLQCIAVRCSVLQVGAEEHCGLVCFAVFCSVLQCIAVRCSVLQVGAGELCGLVCVAVCCSTLQFRAEAHVAVGALETGVCCSVFQRVAACCSVLHRVAVCCSVLQL